MFISFSVGVIRRQRLITEETRWKGLYSSHAINGLVTLPYSAASAARLTGAPD
jgi:hypothetical protein